MKSIILMRKGEEEVLISRSAREKSTMDKIVEQNKIIKKNYRFKERKICDEKNESIIEISIFHFVLSSWLLN